MGNVGSGVFVACQDILSSIDSIMIVLFSNLSLTSPSTLWEYSGQSLE